MPIKGVCEQFADKMQAKNYELISTQKRGKRKTAKLSEREKHQIEVARKN